jgi:hypothetical protein
MSSKKKSAGAAKPTQCTFYVVAVEKIKQVNGIIGPLDLYNVSILLEGTAPPQETVPVGKNPAVWYADYLKTQGIETKGSAELGQGMYALYVDTEKTDLSEFLNVRDCTEACADANTYAWKTYFIPCHAGTFKEALGFWICAQKEDVGPLKLSAVVENAFAAQTNV